MTLENVDGCLLLINKTLISNKFDIDGNNNINDRFANIMTRWK